jgi:hypothetical protein
MLLLLMLLLLGDQLLDELAMLYQLSNWISGQCESLDVPFDLFKAVMTYDQVKKNDQSILVLDIVAFIYIFQFY